MSAARLGSDGAGPLAGRWDSSWWTGLAETGAADPASSRRTCRVARDVLAGLSPPLLPLFPPGTGREGLAFASGLGESWGWLEQQLGGDRARACCARFASCPAASFPAALYPAALFGAEWDFKLGFVDFVRQRPANWSLETAQRGGEQVRRRLARRRRGGQTVGIWPYVGAEPQRYESSE